MSDSAPLNTDALDAALLAMFDVAEQGGSEDGMLSDDARQKLQRIAALFGKDAKQPENETDSSQAARAAGGSVARGLHALVTKVAEHAPKGGITLATRDGQTKFFHGGQWIPLKEVANLTPQSLAQLRAANPLAEQNRAKRQQRGDVDAQQLRAQLRPHNRVLTADEQKRARAELRALHGYHGELTLHRIEELAQQQQGFLRRHDLTDRQRQKVKDNLARLSAMIGAVQKLGVSGKVPSDTGKSKREEELATPRPADRKDVPRESRSASQEPDWDINPDWEDAVAAAASDALDSPEAEKPPGNTSSSEQPSSDKGKDELARLNSARENLRDDIQKHAASGGTFTLTMPGLTARLPVKPVLDGHAIQDRDGRIWPLRMFVTDTGYGLHFDPPAPKAPEAKESEKEESEAKEQEPESKDQEPDPKDQEPEQTDEERAFHAAWNAVLKDDPVSRKLLADGRKEEAQQRVLAQMLKDGTPIPESVQQKHASAFEKAVDKLAAEHDRQQATVSELASPEARWQRALGRDPEVKELIASKNPRKRVRGLLRLMREGLDVPEPVQAEHKDAYRDAEKQLARGQHQSDAHKNRKDERDAWTDKAFEAGIRPRDLHAEADNILREDNEHRERRQKLLSDARKLFAHYGYNANALTTNLRSARVEDDIPSLDVVAYSIAHDYPDEFGGDSYLLGQNEIRDDGSRLRELLTEGVPPKMSRQEAYEQAFEKISHYLQHHNKDDSSLREREAGWDQENEDDDADRDDDETHVPWDDDDEAFPFGYNAKALRAWLRKSRRARKDAPGQQHLFDPAKHPHAPKGPHGGQFVSTHGQAAVDAALARHASHDPTRGGGLFGDSEARRGFAKLPDGTPIVFTEGTFKGRTGKIVRDVDAATGTPRIVASVDGREGVVPISPDAIEPLHEHLSWRVGGGGSGAGTEQGGLFTAEQFLPKRKDTIRPDVAAPLSSAVAHPIIGSPTAEQWDAARRWAAASPGLSPALSAEYAEHLSHALSKLPMGIARDAGEALGEGGVTFHPDLKALRAQAQRINGKSAAGVVGFAHDRGMATDLHLDGGDDPRGTYVHELWHAADNGGFHSDDKGWQAAYKKDILKGKHLLSRYALTNPSEGFAEFGRALATHGLDYMAERFPNAVKHLKAKGLL